MEVSSNGREKVNMIRETDENVAEHSEASENQIQRWYEDMAELMLEFELLPGEKKNPIFQKHCITKGEFLVTEKQRNWIANMLQQFLGNQYVATFVFWYGLPELFQEGLREKRSPLRIATEHFGRWYVLACFPAWVATRATDE